MKRSLLLLFCSSIMTMDSPKEPSAINNIVDLCAHNSSGGLLRLMDHFNNIKKKRKTKASIDMSLNTKLLYGSATHDYGLVLSALTCKADSNCKTALGSNALIMALREIPSNHDFYKIIIALLEADCSIDTCNARGETASSLTYSLEPAIINSLIVAERKYAHSEDLSEKLGTLLFQIHQIEKI